MSLQYVKRNQMAFDFKKKSIPPVALPPDYRCVPWNPELLATHADVQYRGFCNDSDAELFPTFRSAERCRMLMNAIAASNSFCPDATVLIACGHDEGILTFVAAIQGMRLSQEVGAIQNVAVLPDFRQRGLGKALVCSSLKGYRDAGVERVTLEVTADNFPAVRLYESIGFQTYKVYFREIYPDR